jgi:carboxymethylenebutenolidase
MASETYVSGGNAYKVTVNPAPADGKKHPVILLVHGNFGLGPPYGEQIQSFARDLADLGYLTAVPQYYVDDEPHPNDTVPKDRLLADAIAAVVGRADADADRLGLIGFSLGAATAMTFVATNPPGTVKALADFFGFLTPAIRAGVSRFPPTIIAHNKNDQIVPVKNSQELDRLLSEVTDHLLVPPYDERSEIGNHAFKPGGAADVDSRSQVTRWFTTHLHPIGK